MERYKIFGPPGTGKTTYLLSLLDNELQVYEPEQCAYVSFTKQGAYEGAKRAQVKYNYEQKRFPYFRTIHSLCFRALGLRKTDIIGREHYKQFSEALGMNFTGFYTEEFTNENDKYLFASQLYRDNPEQYSKMLMALDYNKLKYVAVNYARFKAAYGLLDFTDMLELYLKEGMPLDVQIAFIDEAQDLTTLQWRVVYKMFQNVRKLYIAGDDDQAIYEWSGADVAQFLKPFKNTIILDQSYRLPQAIHTYAHTIIGNVKQRQEKVFHAQQKPGAITLVSGSDALTIPDECLILARNKAHLNKIADKLKESGRLFLRHNKPSIDPKALRAIELYKIYQQSDSATSVKPGESPEAIASLLQFYKKYFKVIDKNVSWHDAFSDKKDMLYYRKLFEQKTDLSAKPTISLSTIHAAKGAEHDNVILLLDISQRVYKQYITTYDSELRCYYVGVTRAKENLTLKLSESKHTYPLFTQHIKGDRYAQ